MAGDKPKKAVALKYEFGQATAPTVVAKGQGILAEKIIDLARKHGVHIYPDPDLAEALYKLDLLEEIPPHLYQAVAEILAFIYVINKKWEKIKKKNLD